MVTVTLQETDVQTGDQASCASSMPGKRGRSVPGCRLDLGSCGLPVKLQRKATDFRYGLEAQVYEHTKAPISRAQSRHVLMASACFQEYLRFHTLLRGVGLSPETIAAYSDRRIRNLERSLKAIEALGLDKPIDVWSELYGQPAQLPRPQAPTAPTESRVDSAASVDPGASCNVSGVAITSESSEHTSAQERSQ